MKQMLFASLSFLFSYLQDAADDVHSKGKTLWARRKRLPLMVPAGPWTDDEDGRLCLAHERLGNSWPLIATLLPGRTPNACRGRLYKKLQLKSESIDRPQSGGTDASSDGNDIGMPSKADQDIIVSLPACAVPDFSSGGDDVGMSSKADQDIIAWLAACAVHDVSSGGNDVGMSSKTDQEFETALTACALTDCQPLRRDRTRGQRYQHVNTAQRKRLREIFEMDPSERPKHSVTAREIDKLDGGKHLTALQVCAWMWRAEV
jgi:hypothetical protein